MSPGPTWLCSNWCARGLPPAHLCAPGRAACVSCCLCSGWAPCPRHTWLLRGPWVLTSSPRKAAPCSGAPRPPGFSPSPCRPRSAAAERPQEPLWAGRGHGDVRQSQSRALSPGGARTPGFAGAVSAVTGMCPARKRTVYDVGSVPGVVAPTPCLSLPSAAAGWEEGRQGDDCACGAPLLTACPPQHILVAKRQISVAKSGVEEFRQAFRSYTEVTAGQSSCLQ